MFFVVVVVEKSGIINREPAKCAQERIIDNSDLLKIIRHVFCLAKTHLLLK